MQCTIPTHAASAAGVLRLVVYLKDHNLEGEVDMTSRILSIEVAKNTFQGDGVHSAGNFETHTLCIAFFCTSSAIPKSAYS